MATQPSRSGFYHDLTLQLDVVGALVMRELHSRFGRTNIGYLWLIGEPLLLATVIGGLHAFQPGHMGSALPPVPMALLGYCVFIIFRGIVNRSESLLESSIAPCLVTWCAQHDAWLVKPLTFMNRSGAAVAPLVRSLGLELARLIVVYDDLDLEPGRLRMRPHGGAGGHNGVRSILETLGSDAFPRLRIGVGRPRTDAARHVLTALDGDELTHAQIAVAQAAEALGAWIVDADTEGVMTRFHSRWKSMGE